LIHALHDAGYDCMKSGVTIKGTMKVICDEAVACGMNIAGSLPRFMKGLEYPDHVNPVWVDTMAQRKEEMRKETDVAIALPGGIGTLDEISETFCLAKMGIYKGNVIVFNVDGFFDGYKLQLQRCVEEHTIPEEAMKKIFFPRTIEELKTIL